MNNDKLDSSTISLEEEDNICKNLTCSEFTEVCARLNYKQLCQINNELGLRVSRINQQLNDRQDLNSMWRRRAESAIRAMDQKLQIISNRLNLIRENNVHSMLQSIGGLDKIADKRLTLIKCLLYIIEQNDLVSNLTSEENAVLDLCRNLSGPPNRFKGLNYEPSRNVIVSSEYLLVASLAGTGVMVDESGYTMARSFDMKRLIQDVLQLVESIEVNSHCTCSANNEYELCYKCKSYKISADIVELLSEVS